MQRLQSAYDEFPCLRKGNILFSVFILAQFVLHIYYIFIYCARQPNKNYSKIFCIGRQRSTNETMRFQGVTSK